MALVKIGDVIIGSVSQVPAVAKEGIAWQAYRESADGFVLVGQADTKQGALNLLARSIIAKSLDSGGLTPTQRMNLADLQGQLEALGFGELSKAITEVLRT